MRNACLPIALAAALLAACAGDACAQVETTPGAPELRILDWMRGCWIATSSSSVQEEVWLAPRGGLMMGMARSVRDGVAGGFEFVLLRQTEDGLIFTAHPSGQTPADFTATAVTGDLLRVENPAHDFPQKIEYRRVPPDSVVAGVFGDAGAESPSFQIPYVRTPC